MPAESSLAASNPTTITQPPPSQPHPILNANQPPPTPLPVKQFDLVLEFRETSNDRWLIPRSCHPVASRSGSDVNLTMCLSGTGETPSVPSKSENTETELQQVANLPVSFLIKDVPEELWDTIVRWIGGEETMKINREYQESMVCKCTLLIIKSFLNFWIGTPKEALSRSTNKSWAVVNTTANGNRILSLISGFFLISAF